jgi:hypothetical protein
LLASLFFPGIFLLTFLLLMAFLLSFLLLLKSPAVYAIIPAATLVPAVDGLPAILLSFLMLLVPMQALEFLLFAGVSLMLAFLRFSYVIPGVTCIPDIHAVCWNLGVSGVPEVASIPAVA